MRALKERFFGAPKMMDGQESAVTRLAVSNAVGAGTHPSPYR